VNHFWRISPWAVAASVLPLACSGSETSTCNRAATCGGAPHQAGTDPGSGEASNDAGGATPSTAGAGGASLGGDSSGDPIAVGGNTNGPSVGGWSGDTEAGGRGGDGGDGGVAPEPPTVLILLDGSSSMLQPTRNSPAPWAIVRDALMDQTFGALRAFEDRIRFGFTSYRGSSISHAEDDPDCATLASVGFGLDNYDAIQTTYAGISTATDRKWETPTGHALRRATEQLLSEPGPGKKYIFLLTDGEPSTCQVLDPNCGQDLAVAAVQAAYAKGIVTRTIGLLVDGEGQNAGCDPQWGRCGLDHIQDVANAGSGQPVHAPPDAYVYQQCFAATGRLTAEYAVDGGNAPVLIADSAGKLASLLQMQFQEILDE